MLPEMSIPALQKQLKDVKRQHDKDSSEGFGTVYMPYELSKKYLAAAHAIIATGGSPQDFALSLRHEG